MNRSSEEALIGENTEERVADRPRVDPDEIPPESLAIDDTGPEPIGGMPIDDV